MADNATVLAAFREELILAGLGRRLAGEGANTVDAPYPVVIEPRDGPPAPGELIAEDNDHAELVVSLFAGGDLSEGSGYDAALRRRAVVDVRYRADGNVALRKAMALDAAIRVRLIRPATNYGYGFTLGGDGAGGGSPVFVHEAEVWGGFGPISRVRGQAFDHVAKWLLEVRP